MDNVEFLKYLREDMQNMEKRLSDRMTNEISRIDCKIDSLNNNITSHKNLLTFLLEIDS